MRHLLARCGRPNVRGLIDEDSNPGPDSDRRSLLPISRFASSYSHRSPIRGLRSGFGRLAGIFAATGFGKPSNSRTNPVSNILYVEGAAPPGAAGSRRPANPAEPLRTIRPERVTPLLKYELRNFRRSLGCRHLVFCRCHDANNDYHTISITSRRSNCALWWDPVDRIAPGPAWLKGCPLGQRPPPTDVA